MTQIVVRLAALVIVASILPLPRSGAQGQGIITSRAPDTSWQYFPCASGVVEKQDLVRAKKSEAGNAIKSGVRKRSRREGRRL